LRHWRHGFIAYRMVREAGTRRWLEGASSPGAEIAETLPMLNVECSGCGRHGRSNTAKLVERLGADETLLPSGTGSQRIAQGVTIARCRSAPAVRR
jgi:hypothetical protein